MAFVQRITSPAYYNDFDPGACAWLEELIRAGLIPPGEVDRRSILDVCVCQTSRGSPKSISSPGSAAGLTHCASRAGRMIARSGLAVRRASRSASQENRKDAKMRDTSPPSLSAWSGPAAPECCLASRSPARMCSERLQSALEETLSRRLNGLGSTIYSIGWKLHVTPLGRAISRLRASAPRTSASAPSSEPSAMSGWPTPKATDEQMARRSSEAADRFLRRPQKSSELGIDVHLAGWSTASARDWKDTAGMATEAVNPDGSTRTRLDQLPRQAQMAGWPTPVANDDNKTPEAHLAMKKRMGERDGTGAERTAITSLQVMAKYTQPARFTASGEMLTGCSAGMESGGQLNPDLSRWLMGYPAEWGSCGATAMQSIRTRRQSSSGRSRKRSQDSPSPSPMQLIYQSLLPICCEAA